MNRKVFLALFFTAVVTQQSVGAQPDNAAGGGGQGFVPNPNSPGSEMVRHDPLAIYKKAGIDADQEKKIRQFAKDFEDGQRVRLKLIANLLREMRALQMTPDPDEKKVISTQDSINKAQDEMAMERIKLVLKIRGVMSFDQKQRLVQMMQGPAFGQSGGGPGSPPGGPGPGAVGPGPGAVGPGPGAP